MNYGEHALQWQECHKIAKISNFDIRLPGWRARFKENTSLWNKFTQILMISLLNKQIAVNFIIQYEMNEVRNYVT